MIAFLISDTGLTTVRFFKAGGVAIGFFSHLLLDEIWSVNLTKKGPMIKKSFGTAIKFFGPSAAGNSAAYGILIFTSLLVFQDAQPVLSAKATSHPPADTHDFDPDTSFDQPLRHATSHHREAIYE
jgi:hypothetical protein